MKLRIPIVSDIIGLSNMSGNVDKTLTEASGTMQLVKMFLLFCTVVITIGFIVYLSKSGVFKRKK